MNKLTYISLIFNQTIQNENIYVNNLVKTSAWSNDELVAYQNLNEDCSSCRLFYFFTWFFFSLFYFGFLSPQTLKIHPTSLFFLSSCTQSHTFFFLIYMVLPFSIWSMTTQHFFQFNYALNHAIDLIKSTPCLPSRLPKLISSWYPNLTLKFKYFYFSIKLNK
jgi:hypothetical protein